MSDQMVCANCGRKGSRSSFTNRKRKGERDCPLCDSTDIVPVSEMVKRLAALENVAEKAERVSNSTFDDGDNIYISDDAIGELREALEALEREPA